MSRQQASPSYPFTYRAFFTYMDPLICIWGAYMDFFDPTLVLSSHIPNLPYDVGHAMILKQRGGGMLNFGFISAVLLRYTSDLVVWRIVQFANLLVDFTYFWGAGEALAAQGRLAAEKLRVEDWAALTITGVATAMRVAFLLGIGVEKAGARGRKKA